MEEAFRQQVLTYFRKGMFNRIDQLAAGISMNLVVQKNAKKIARQFQAGSESNYPTVEKHFSVKVYNGHNPTALKIKDYLHKNSATELIGAYVHGSIATNEEISYSDFDGLVIVKDQCMADEHRLAKLFASLKQTELMMIEMDPLQHHGWFVLTQADLTDYPEYYFPAELFNHAAMLIGEEKISIHLRKDGYKKSFVDSFHRLTKSLLTKLSNGSYLQNYYAFKNLLSEFMLLPAIYLQAKTGNGIFKKISFGVVEKELGPVYNVMNTVSELREQWNYYPPGVYLELRKKNKLSTSNLYASRSGELPAELRNRFTNELAAPMKEFVYALQKHFTLKNI